MSQNKGATSIVRMTAGAITLACAMLATGCTTLPTSPRSIKAVVAHAQDEVTRDWNVTPALRVRNLDAPAVEMESAPIPEAIAKRPVDLTLTSTATVSDLAIVLTSVGVPTIPASSEVGDKKIAVPQYRGTFGGLLPLLRGLQGLSFSWHEGALVVGTGTAMSASLPPAKDVVDAVSKDLKNLGASNIVSSLDASEVSFDVPSSQTWRVKHYLQRVVGNAATIGLQVAVITVSLDREKTTGLDWSRLQLTLGQSGLMQSPGGGSGSGGNGLPRTGDGGNQGAGNNNGNGNGSGNGNSGGRNTGNSNGQDGSGDQPLPFGVAGGLLGGSFGLVANRSHFNMQALFSLLSTYGETRTTQNLVLRTLSGGKVKIRSGASVPYVSSVSATIAGQSGSVFGGTQTETVDTGLTLTIEPRYDSTTGRVAMDVDLQLKSILGFLQLNAGQQVGSMSRPEVQDQSLTTVARAAAGQTVVLGGILYDQLTDNRNTLAGLENAKVGHQDKKVQRNALFVVIRPTVTTYQFADQQAAKGVAGAD